MTSGSSKNKPGKRQASRQQKSKAPNAPASQKSKAVVSTGRSTLAYNFARTISDPFGPMAVGSRVPDVFSFPTSTHHLHGSFTVTSGGEGTAGLIVLPNPVFSFIDGKKDSGFTSCFTGPVTANGAGLYGATTASALGSIYSSYRVVACGIRINNLQAPLSATGTITIAHVPAQSDMSYGAGLIASAGTDQLVGNLNSGIKVSATIANLPGARQSTVSQLLDGGFHVTLPPHNPAFWTFRSTDTVATISGTKSAYQTWPT
jgi:hypothetical protein